MKIIKTASLLGATLVLAVVFGLIGNNDAFAATKTWIGDETKTDGMLWSNGANWQPAGVPTKDDDVVVDPNTYSSGLRIDGDIEVNSITAKLSSKLNTPIATIIPETGSNKMMTIKIGKSTENVSFGTLYVSNNQAPVTVIANGDNVTMKYVDFGYGVTLNLNGKTVNLDRFRFDDKYDNAPAAKITGNGTLNLSDSTKSIHNRIAGDINDYTGTTNINGISNLQLDYLNAFGKSAVNVKSSSLDWQLFLKNKPADVNGKTIDNKFSLDGAKDAAVLTFEGDDSYKAAKPTIKVPNITLLSNIGIDAHYIVLDLTGINANGKCMQYWTENGINQSISSNFIGAPTECRVGLNYGDTGKTPAGGSSNKKANLPGVPNTSVGAIVSNPITVIVVGVIVAGVVFGLTKSKKFNK